MSANDDAFRDYAARHPDSVPIFQPELRLLAGAERSLLALAQWFHQQGRAAHLVTYVDSCDFARFASFPLPVHAIAPTGGFVARLLALRTYFRHAQTAPLLSGYQATLHASLAGIGTFHCLMHDTPVLFEAGEPEVRPGLRHGISNTIIGRGMRRGGGHMIVTSEFLQRDCERIFGLHADIARMGGMGDQGAFRLRAVDAQLNLLSVSRIESNKRIDWMLDALASLERQATPLSSRVNWHLDVAGQGDQLDAMRLYAEELGLAERVRFHGFVSDAELAHLYDDAHLFVMPAVQGYGIPAIEALGRGIPVLLHRESGVSDVLRETPWAFVMTGGREAFEPALAEAIGAVLAGHHHRAPLPELPTEGSWAERVATLCGYL